MSSELQTIDNNQSTVITIRSESIERAEIVQALKNIFEVFGFRLEPAQKGWIIKLLVERVMKPFGIKPTQYALSSAIKLSESEFLLNQRVTPSSIVEGLREIANKKYLADVETLEHQRRSAKAEKPDKETVKIIESFSGSNNSAKQKTSGFTSAFGSGEHEQLNDATLYKKAYQKMLGDMRTGLYFNMLHRRLFSMKQFFNGIKLEIEEFKISKSSQVYRLSPEQKQKLTAEFELLIKSIIKNSLHYNLQRQLNLELSLQQCLELCKPHPDTTYFVPNTEKNFQVLFTTYFSDERIINTDLTDLLIEPEFAYQVNKQKLDQMKGEK